MRKAVKLTLLLASAWLVAMQGGAAKSKSQGELVITAITQTFAMHGALSTNHSLMAYYHATRRAPGGATASLDLPPGLGCGANIPMQVNNIDRNGASTEVDVLQFWGEGNIILRGQPHVRKGSGAYMPHYRGGSTGVADLTRVSTILASASCAGTYVAHVGYVGDTPINFSEAQDFLEPVLFDPPSGGHVDFSKPIVFRWSFVRHSVGYQITATGHNAEGAPVMWENALDSAAWRNRGASAALRAGKLIPAYQTSCVVPQGIFAQGPVVVNIVALSAETRGNGVLNAIGWSQSMTSTQLTP